MSLSANEADAAVRPRPYLAVALGIVALTLLAYAPIWRNDFFYLDDDYDIVSNPPIAKGLSPETIRWAWTTTHHGYWNPLTWMSLLGDVSLFGFHAWGMHLTNLLLHIATSVGLFLVFAWMTDEFRASALLAGLFAVHPLHVESVAWAAERKDTLSTLLLVLTIASYVAAARRPSFGWRVTTIVLYALGLLSKAMLVTLPFALLLLDVWPLRRTNLTADSSPSFERRSWFALIAEKLPLFALAFAFSVVTFRLQKGVGAVASLELLPWQPRIANVLNGYVWYLQKTFVPTHLAVFHSHRLEIPPIEMIFPAVLLAAITLFFVTQFRKHPELLVGWLWFVGTLFPVSGISQSGSQAYADRFAYVPHIGLFIVIVWGGLALVRRWPIRVAISAAALGVCAILTAQQVALWRNTDTLFRHTLAVTSDNKYALLTYGDYCRIQGRLDEAAEHLQSVVAIDERTLGAFDLLGRIDVERGRFAEAEPSLRKALAIRPGNPETRFRLGYALFMQGKFDEAGNAIERLAAGFPQWPEVQELLGKVRAAQGR
jgi:protein O-mannosyl-transferase